MSSGEPIKNRDGSVDVAAGEIRKLWEKHGIKGPLRFLGFCLSLLPVPVINQVGKVIDRHLSDKASSAKLEAVWNEIRKINEAVDNVKSLEEAIILIAETVKNNESARKITADYMHYLKSADSEFSVVTESESLQELAEVVIQAGRVSISTTGHSTTHIRDSKVESEDIRLHAAGGSHNRVDRTSFEGKTGSIAMDKVSLLGDIGLKNTEFSTFSRGPDGGAVQDGQILSCIGGGPGGAFMGVPHCPRCQAPLFNGPSGRFLCKRCNQLF